MASSGIYWEARTDELAKEGAELPSMDSACKDIPPGSRECNAANPAKGA
jgi:hypothetical protein